MRSCDCRMLAGCLYCVLRWTGACKALSIIIAVSNQGDASRTVDALTAVIMYLHGDHFWPVVVARLAPPPLAFNQIVLSLFRWMAAGWGIVCVLWECDCVYVWGVSLSHHLCLNRRRMFNYMRQSSISLSLGLSQSTPLAWSVLFHPASPPQAGLVVSRLMRLSMRGISEREEPSRGEAPSFT